jgi:NADPH:quinone reductase-like Zn-dependent oxidoreductase
MPAAARIRTKPLRERFSWGRSYAATRLALLTTPKRFAYAARDPKAARAAFEKVLNWAAEGKLKPHISHTFPLDKVPDAMQTLLARKVIGKAVIKVR